MSATAPLVACSDAISEVDCAVLVCCSTDVNCASWVMYWVGSLLLALIGFWFLSSVMSSCRNWFSLSDGVALVLVALVAEVAEVPVVTAGLVMLMVGEVLF